jgi:hypothetical protein
MIIFTKFKDNSMSHNVSTYCYFVFWTPKGILFEKVDRDEQFFANKMQKQLHNFYYNYYADEFLKMQLKN